MYLIVLACVIDEHVTRGLVETLKMDLRIIHVLRQHHFGLFLTQNTHF